MVVRPVFRREPRVSETSEPAILLKKPVKSQPAQIWMNGAMAVALVVSTWHVSNMLASTKDAVMEKVETEVRDVRNNAVSKELFATEISHLTANIDEGKRNDTLLFEAVGSLKADLAAVRAELSLREDGRRREAGAGAEGH